MNVLAGPVTRPYRMGRRAETAERTRAAVIEATLSFVPQRAWEDVTIEEVAQRAGVHVRTVLRRFGSKDGLARAVVHEAGARVAEQRTGGAPGDVAATVAELTEHYERWGDTALWMLDQRRAVPVLADAAAAGTRLHEAWVARVFAPQLAAHPVRSARRRRLLAALGAATDVHTWEALRRRSGLSRRETETALAELCRGLLAGTER